jgi:hypothetical protein
MRSVGSKNLFSDLLNFLFSRSVLLAKRGGFTLVQAANARNIRLAASCTQFGTNFTDVVYGRWPP